MPSLSILLATITLLFTALQASPLALQKRNIGGLRLCDQIHWQGDCWYGILPLNSCIALNSLYVTLRA